MTNYFTSYLKLICTLYNLPKSDVYLSNPTYNKTKKQLIGILIDFMKVFINLISNSFCRLTILNKLMWTKTCIHNLLKSNPPSLQVSIIFNAFLVKYKILNTKIFTDFQCFFKKSFIKLI